METLDSIIGKYTDDDELILFPKKPEETHLAELFL